MKKIVLGFIALGLLTLAGCEKDDDTDMDTTAKTETSDSDGRTDSDKGDDITDTSSDEGTDSDDGTTETSSDDGSTGSDDEGTDTDSGDGTTDDSTVEYGEGATDIVGNTYKSVIIGDQEWMAENLRTTKYSDGTPIPNVTDETEWYNDTTGAWCHYDNDNKYDTIYGKLYNWYAVETSKLCPTGWHVPTDSEWTELTDYLYSNGYSGEEGKVLKATSGWDDDGNGTDNYGWNGLPGGYRYGLGDFYSIGSISSWWSSSYYDTYFSSYAETRNLLNSFDDVSLGSNFKMFGHSVRCLKD